MTDLIIVGAGGLGREVFAYAQDAHADGGPYRAVGFLDDDPDALASFSLGVSVLESVQSHAPRDAAAYIVAIGDPGVRAKVAAQLGDVSFATLVHPRAYVAESASLGDGSVVAPFAFVGPSARLGAHTLLNTYASAGHDAVFGDACTLSPYAVVNGAVELGDEVFLGTGAIVQPQLAVGRRSRVSAGSVVTRAVEPLSLAVGNPARARVMYAD